MGEPIGGERAAVEPAIGELLTGEPAAVEPVTGGPATGLLATDGPATDGPAADGPAADGPLLTIGQLAAETGVPSSTIRCWERKGLLAPARRQSGQRRYEPTAARSVALLRLCQEAGLTLADIRRFRDERAVTPGSWHTLVEQKLADVERQITALEHARKLLSHAATCHHDDLLACPGFQEWFETYLNQSEAEHPTSDRP
jgi:DNA-binding transcriptional MerR regulator